MATRRPKVPPSRAGSQAGSIEYELPGTAEPGASFTAAKAASPGKKPGDGKLSDNKKPGTRGAGKAPGGKSADSKGGRPAAGQAPTPVPARAFSGRLLALAVVLLTITVLLAPSVHTYLQQGEQISALSQDIAAKTQQQSDLKSELSRWSDPAYIKQQARDRVNMVMPGETGYWVYGADGISAQPESSNAKSQAAPPENLPWVDGLWESIRRSATG